ncbi:MAG: hypothetical protein VR72_13020 [Clostridiaceae bacterium BRH_c20a]|nr:MAG: hypothetical protein VR72_13020 [Clostridiaceae bacterium BRH_c20a]
MEEIINIDDVELSELVKMTDVYAITEKYTQNISLSVSLFDASVNLLTELARFPAFCKLCIKEKVGNCIISSPDQMQVDNNLNVNCCKFGLYSVQSSIKINGRLLGYLGCGYGRTSLTSSFEKNLIKRLFSDKNRQAALEEYSKLGFVNPIHLKSTAEILSFVSAYLVRLIIESAREKQVNMYKLSLTRERQRQAELESSLNEARLMFLEAQVNPHFLFNTLNTIVQASIIEGANTAASLTYALANLLRCSLGKVDNLISIKEELNHIEDYLLIQKSRFPNRFTVEAEISEEIMNIKIPFMAIMVLVENSIIHGFANISWPGKLKIKAFIENSYAVIQVVDNGCGISKQVIEEVNSFRGDLSITPSLSKGIGLKNIFKRLQYYYGEKFNFNIGIMSEKGTEITIKIPLD